MTKKLTKPVPGKRSPNSTLNDHSGDFKEVLTLAEAAEYLRVAEEDLLPMVHQQGLPGRQIGQEWRFLKSALRTWLETSPTLDNPKEQLLRWAGAFKDDPDLQEIVREAYQQRGRSITEEGE
jgi:excisionase family DNA binding protein